jgi:hypothetical protein
MATTAEQLIGPEVRVAQANWIAPECGDEYHEFLQEAPDDSRTAVMAEALREDFGARHQPLLVLPDLLEEVSRGERPESTETETEHRSQLTVLTEILAAGYVEDVQLHGLALPSKADPDGSWAVPAGTVPGTVRERIESLRLAVSEHIDANSIATHVTEVIPEMPVFNTLYNNALCNEFARRLEPRLIASGWSTDKAVLVSAISKILSNLNGRGVYLGLSLSSERLEEMADFIYKRLLQA